MIIKFIISHNIPIYSIFAIFALYFLDQIHHLDWRNTKIQHSKYRNRNLRIKRALHAMAPPINALPGPLLPRTSTYRASSSPLFLETSLAGRETTDGQEEEKEDEPLVKVQLTHVEHGEREGKEDGEAGDNEEESGIPAPGRRIHRGLIGNERAEKSRKKLPTRMMKTLEN